MIEENFQTLYVRVANYLLLHGVLKTHIRYKLISIEELTQAKDYYESLRCDGCMCGSCIDLEGFASTSIDNHPAAIKSIGRLVHMLIEQEKKWLSKLREH